MEDVLNKILTLSLTFEEMDFVKDISNFVSDLAIKYHVPLNKKDSIKHIVAYMLNFRLEDNQRHGDFVKLQIFETSNSLRITITDKGTPYLMSSEEVELLRQGWVDAYSNERLGKDGQRITFVYMLQKRILKKIDASIIDDEILLDREFTFRKTRCTNEDINEVIKCLYNAYGYEYGHQDLYDFDKFKKFLRSKNYKSYLIENDHHQVVSHVGLHEHNNFKGLPEIGNLVTKGFARGNQLAERVVEDLINIEEKSGDYQGVFMVCFAAHPITQKIAKKLDFTPCAFYFQNVPPEGCGKYRKGDNRLDGIYAVRLFENSGKRTIYVKEETLPLIDKVYKSQHLEYEAISTYDELEHKPSEVEFSIDPVMRLLEIRIDYYGDDYADYIDKMMDMLKEIKVDVITAFVNVDNPAALCLYEDCKKEDYVFTGILPGSKNGDYLILQKFLQPLDTSLAVVIEGTDELLEDIKRINNIKDIK